MIVAEDPMDGSPWQGRYLYDSQAIWPRHNDTPPGEGRLTAPAEPLRQFLRPPLQPFHRSAGSLVRLPGRIPRGARLGTVAAGRVEGGLGRAEPVGRGVVGFLGVLAGGVGLLQRRLCGGQPAAQY